jgi:oligoribonuclease NrnB/cAMP/cGMP phosphodiesterase (DHH superfamily)
MSKNTIIYYHNPCQDGFASMFVATRFLKDYTLVPYSHGQDIITTYENQTIYFLDMAPSVEIYKKLIENNKVIILDHHKSNFDEYTKHNINDKNVIIIDEKKEEASGVGVTWDYFADGNREFTYAQIGGNMPYFLQLIQDRDIWKFKLPETKDFCEGLYFTSCTTELFSETMSNYEELYSNPEKIQYYIKLGNLLLKKKNNTIKYLTEKYIQKVYNYKGHKVCMANVDYELTSDLGNSLSARNECDFAILWRYDHEYESYSLSFRSNNKVDVSTICKQFGGGGHKNASGCSIKIHPLIVFAENNN